LFGSFLDFVEAGMALSRYLRDVLVISKKFVDQMVSHCLDGYPLEACGLLSGVEAEPGTTRVTGLYETDNVAASAKVYEVEPRALLRADRDAEANGSALVGVYHSHTHTEARPSPTDVEQAPDPQWHYVLVSLRDVHPSVRSWRIQAGSVEEEKVVLEC
jgi:proteasome lid subunit RPN8/RPN11